MADRVYGTGNAIGLSNRIVLRGKTDALLLLRDSTKNSEHELGFDTLTRTYFCRRDLEDTYRPRAGDVDFEFKKLRYWQHTWERKGAWTFFNVTFNGYLKDRARIVRSDHDLKQQEQTLSLLNGSGQTCTLVFIGGTVTSRYASPRRPQASEPVAALPDSYLQVIGLRGAGGIQLSGSGRITIAMLRNIFGLKVVDQRTNFKRTLEGAVWFCDETVDRIPIQEAAAIQL